jgi:hypothetical protein
VAEDLVAVGGPGPVIGRPTTAVVAAAARAAVAGGTDPAHLDPVLDVAAALMVVRTPGAGFPLVDGLAAGHCLAAGWLAPRVVGAGLVGMAGALRDTVSTVTGRPARDLRRAPVPVGTGAPGRAGDLLAELM